MKRTQRNLLLLLSLHLYFVNLVYCYCQFATIVDNDGYTNVRSKPQYESKVIYKIRENEVFIYDHCSKNDSLSWIEIYIPKNKFSVCFECNTEIYIYGYIHRSRIQPIDQFPLYDGQDLIFKYDISSFTEKGKIIDYNEKNGITHINGRIYYGADEGRAKFQVDKLNIELYNQNIFVSPLLIEDIFECTNNFEIFKNKDTFFVEQWNSDGAGAYGLLWVFDRNKIKQRIILMP